MTRAFVAAVPPGDVLDAIGALEWGEVAGVRACRRDQWHVTLQFLGNRADIDAVSDRLKDLAVRRGRVRLGGGGAFPNERRGRVLWLGLREGAALFSQLGASVGALLTPLGYPPEARTYHPHVTLARCKAPTDLRPAVAALGTEPVGPAWTVEEVVLFESRTRREGAEYVERGCFPLGP